MQVSLPRVLLKNNFGRKKKRQDTILEERLSFSQSGIGKMNMVVELTINSEDMVSQLIGIDSLSLWMTQDIRLLLRLL